MKKNKPIKHKLWGALKREAMNHFKIFPRPGCDLYEIKFWCVDHYEDYGKDSTLYHPWEMKKLKKEVEIRRDEYFERRCLEVLYERRCNRVNNF